MVLDLGADDGVHIVMGGEYRLELVEDDHDARLGPLRDHLGQSQAVEQGRGRLVGGAGADRDVAEAGNAKPDIGVQGPPQALPPPSQSPPEGLRVGALDALGDIAERHDPKEVHVHAERPGAVGIGQNPSQQ